MRHAVLFMRLEGFKPQRGKFTRHGLFASFNRGVVSNPNGVNLHSNFSLRASRRKSVSNPNGVNLHTLSTPPETGSPLVSNPNGVNLHKFLDGFGYFPAVCFKPQRGKFTRYRQCLRKPRATFQTPTG